jgi:tetratricopeptide (TPR) repeat protein
MSDKKPVIFISYSHKDEPEHPRDGEVQWLSFVRTYLQPAVKHGIFDLWVDRNMPGSADWEVEIEEKLRACDIFILLVSAHSMASDFIIDKEIAVIRERQARGELVYFFSLLLTPTPAAGFDKVRDKNLRPRDAKPFSGYSAHDRAQHMSDAADEIAALVEQVAKRKVAAARPTAALAQTAYVHITGLPETAYEKLRGRDDQLKRLDDAWTNRSTNILSLIAEGGAGKSALVNEWLKRLQADNYRGAELVLGWSFYSQGTKERATSAEQFLNWALDKLGIRIETTSATAKGDAIAEAMMKRRVLLLLDGCEPLQHGLDRQYGELKDQGLRALLRRFASTPPDQVHGLAVLTSRLPVKDIARWNYGAAPVVDVDKLSDEAGAALLRDNSVWGTQRELEGAAYAFGGHPLALGLLASLLKETQRGDVRRRDHVRALLQDEDDPRHGHAKRVMASYEREWLADRPVEHAVMHMVGLFDRPANDGCVRALRKKPTIEGLTRSIVDLDDGDWERSIARLREVRLLAPVDPSAPDALDAHPLVREWFGERLRLTKEEAWKAAHGRLYEHLRDTTKEGKTPTLEDLGPLYQAIAHGCRAERHQEVLEKIYANRICRQRPSGGMEFYAIRTLGALNSDLAAISWFFNQPYETPVATLKPLDQAWVLNLSSFSLRAQGRFAEALRTERTALRMAEKASDWRNAAQGSSNLGEVELTVGEIAAALVLAEQSVVYADRSGDGFCMTVFRTGYATALHAAGRNVEAENLFCDAERRQKERQPTNPMLYSMAGYRYCDLLIAKGDHASAKDRATKTIVIARRQGWLLPAALDILTVGRACLGLLLKESVLERQSSAVRGIVRARLEEAVDTLPAAGSLEFIPCGLLARAAFRCSIGDWDGTARDLDEVEEIAEPGPMKLHLCDVALERARLAFAKIEVFAPLNEMIDDSPPKPGAPDAAEATNLQEEARKQLAIAADSIKTCGYHRRDEELAELEAVLRGERKFADLPPRV